MSHLIELDETIKKQYTQYQDKHSTQRTQSKIKRLLNSFTHKFEKADESCRLKINKTQTSFQAYMERTPICCDYSFLSKILYRDSQNHVKYSTLLLKGRKPYTINTHSMRIASLIYLFELHKQLSHLTITIDQNNGEIKIKNFLVISEEILNRANLFQAILYKMFMETVQNQDLFKKMLKYIANDMVLNKKLKIPSVIDPTYKKVQLMLKYLKVCFIELNVSDRQSQMQKMLKKRQLMQRNRIHKSVPINISQFQISKSMSLFQISQFPSQLFERLQDIIISQQEIKQFNPYLQYPQAKIVNQSENEFIFNQITIKNPENINVISSHMKGGTSQMSAAKVQFQYTINTKSQKSKNRKEIQRMPGLLEKYLLIKNPINKNTKQYTQHQIKILSTLKLAKSAYLIKYYKTEQNCAFQNLLMMDFLPNCPDLHNYIERNKKTLSVLSKLVLLSNIANGLRFLKNHHIVHMDLTLKNIMVGPNLVTKIIDFGESYCHMVKSSNYNPGFTNPYGPPQVFTQKQFSTKQDVFSFGIIMFRILFGNLPFEPTEKLKQSYRKKTYNSKLFFAIESLTYTWLQTPMLLLFSLFIRCKDVDQLSRPYPTWMRVILKMFMDWYKNMCLRESDFYQRRSM